MFKAIAIALGGLGAALALFSVTASAQTGTSSSWGSYGYGQQIPTQALSPFDREWNHGLSIRERSGSWIGMAQGASRRGPTLLAPVPVIGPLCWSESFVNPPC